MKKIKLLILLTFVISFCVGCELPGTLEAKVSFEPSGNQSLTYGEIFSFQATFTQDVKSYMILSYKNGEYQGSTGCNKVNGPKTVEVYARKLNDSYYYTFDMYADTQCTEELQSFLSPTYTVDKNFSSVDTRCENSKNWGTYCRVTDESNGGYKQIGQKGTTNNWGLCYSVGYGKKMINNTAITTKTTNCYSYITEKTAASSSELFDIIRKEILKNNKPVIVGVQNSKYDGQHYILVTGIMKDNVKKTKSMLSYSDFWVVDSEGKSQNASTSELPIEENWQALIDFQQTRTGSNRTLSGFKYFLFK